MKRVAQFICIGMLVAGSGCHDLEHSRQIDNESVAGRTIALQVCSNCHGVHGVSVSPTFPKLAGQPHEYIVAQLTDFKTHARADPNARNFMWGFTHLSDHQIDELATYFSSQPPVLGEPGERALIDEGRAIYSHGIPDKGVSACIACHGQHGEGQGAFPRLAGQHADYVVKQLLVFQGTESRPRGAPMKAVCTNMSEHDMLAVATYLEAFPLDTTEEQTTRATPTNR